MIIDMRTEERRKEDKSEKKAEKKKLNQSLYQRPLEIIIIQLIISIVLIKCDNSVNDSKHGKIESQSEIIGIWKPLKAELYRKGMNVVDSTINYSRYDYFYELIFYNFITKK